MERNKHVVTPEDWKQLTEEEKASFSPEIIKLMNAATKKVMVIEEVTKTAFERELGDALEEGFIPYGQPQFAFGDGRYKEIERYVAIVIRPEVCKILL